MCRLGERIKTVGCAAWIFRIFRLTSHLSGCHIPLRPSASLSKPSALPWDRTSYAAGHGTRNSNVTFTSGALMRSRSTKSGNVKPLSALSHSRLRQIMFALASFTSFRSSRGKVWVQPFCIIASPWQMPLAFQRDWNTFAGIQFARCICATGSRTSGSPKSTFSWSAQWPFPSSELGRERRSCVRQSLQAELTVAPNATADLTATTRQIRPGSTPKPAPSRI